MPPRVRANRPFINVNTHDGPIAIEVENNGSSQLRRGQRTLPVYYVTVSILPGFILLIIYYNNKIYLSLYLHRSSRQS